jgi:hypothetical protein
VDDEEAFDSWLEGLKWLGLSAHLREQQIRKFKAPKAPAGAHKGKGKEKVREKAPDRLTQSFALLMFGVEDGETPEAAPPTPDAPPAEASPPPAGPVSEEPPAEEAPGESGGIFSLFRTRGGRKKPPAAENPPPGEPPVPILPGVDAEEEKQKRRDLKDLLERWCEAEGGPEALREAVGVHLAAHGEFFARRFAGQRELLDQLLAQLPKEQDLGQEDLGQRLLGCLAEFQPNDFRVEVGRVGQFCADLQNGHPPVTEHRTHDLAVVRYLRGTSGKNWVSRMATAHDLGRNASGLLERIEQHLIRLEKKP